MDDEFRYLIGAKEKVFYVGKPDKNFFTFVNVFVPIHFFVLFLTIFYYADRLWFFILLFGIVVGYLINLFYLFEKYENRSFVVTDKAIYVSKGIFKKSYKVKRFEELAHVELRRGLLDRMFGVGDIYTTINQTRKLSIEKDSHAQMDAIITISGISDYEETFKLVNKLQIKVYNEITNQYRLKVQKKQGIR